MATSATSPTSVRIWCAVSFPSAGFTRAGMPRVPASCEPPATGGTALPPIEGPAVATTGGSPRTSRSPPNSTNTTAATAVLKTKLAKNT